MCLSILKFDRVRPFLPGCKCTLIKQNTENIESFLRPFKFVKQIISLTEWDTFLATVLQKSYRFIIILAFWARLIVLGFVSWLFLFFCFFWFSEVRWVHRVLQLLVQLCVCRPFLFRAARVHGCRRWLHHRGFLAVSTWRANPVTLNNLNRFLTRLIKHWFSLLISLCSLSRDTSRHLSNKSIGTILFKQVLAWRLRCL